VLESAQAGLNWLTILRKRQNYKKAYSGFNVNKVAKYGRKEIKQLMNNPGIVRNLKKIEASVNNANCFIDIKKEFGSFSNYLWKYADNKQITNSWKSLANLPANTVLSDAIAKDLKKRGFKFLGSTTIYAHLQATGVVNDHVVDCFRYREIKKQITTG
jgi:DNA-3-methyladenine glycosylase I